MSKENLFTQKRAFKYPMKDIQIIFLILTYSPLDCIWIR